MTKTRLVCWMLGACVVTATTAGAMLSTGAGRSGTAPQDAPRALLAQAGQKFMNFGSAGAQQAQPQMTPTPATQQRQPEERSRRRRSH
jgi:hypothetical protein